MTNPMYETPIEISQVQWSVQSGARADSII